jgi:hypothetical protein
MSLLKKLFVLLFLFGIYASANAAVGDVSTGYCNVFSESDGGAKGKEEGGEKEGGEGKEGEEEPDCE